MVVSNVGSFWPTRLPRVTRVRLMRPAISARMSVYSSFSFALASAACAEPLFDVASLS